MWVGDCGNFAKDEFNCSFANYRSGSAKDLASRQIRLVGEIFTDALKRLAGDDETCNLTSTQLQYAHMDHQTEKRYDPSYARNTGIPPLLVELAKCLVTERKKHDSYPKFNKMKEVNLGWLFEGNTRRSCGEVAQRYDVPKAKRGEYDAKKKKKYVSKKSDSSDSSDSEEEMI